MQLRLKVALGALILATAAGGCKRLAEEAVAAQNPYPPSSPLHAPFDRMLRRTATDPRYLKLIAEADDPAAARRKALELAIDGMPRLDDQALVERMRLTAYLLEASSEIACARLARPSADTRQVLSTAIDAGLKKMTPEQIDAWFELSYQAINAALDQTPAPALDETQAQNALVDLVRSMPEDSRDKALSTLVSPDQADPTDLCRTARMVHREALKRPARERAILARTLVDGV